MIDRLRNDPRVRAFARRNPRLADALKRNPRLYDALRGTTYTRPSGKAGAKGNPLEQYFRTNPGRLIHKWHHYFAIYHRHFARFRGRPITVVEFGVSNGGSLQMWRDYFGPDAKIWGTDINPDCARFAEPGTEIVIGDQEDREFLRSLAARTGPIDVLIEDGGHTMRQQIHTLEEFWPHIKDGGVFLIEDLHTSYWNNYEGGYRREGTFIEYAKNIIDSINAWHSREDGFAPDDWTHTVRGMHVYDSIIVFDKGRVKRPRASMTGERQFSTP